MTLPRQIRHALAMLGAVAAMLALAAGTALADDETVGIAGLEFQPAEITIAVGDTVTWEVTEGIGSPHSVTSGTPGDPDEGALFDSGAEGLADVGQTFAHTFEEEGTFDYFCTVHGATMSGAVIVLAEGESPASETPGSSPVTSPAAEPSGEAHAPGVPGERKAIAGGVLIATLVILFGAAAVWRRMNPA